MSDRNYVIVPPRRCSLNHGIYLERVFANNGIRNPRFDPDALPDFQPTVYRSDLYISEENPTGEFPPAMTSDYINSWVMDFAKGWDGGDSGQSIAAVLHAAEIVETNITYKGETFSKVMVLNAQIFNIDIPPNPNRPFDTNELATLAVKRIGDADSDTTVKAPPESACTICREDFVQGAEVVKLICDHIFCRDCIKTWLKRTGNCPNCKSLVRQAGLQGATLLTTTEGTLAGGVLALSDELLTREDEDTIPRLACLEFMALCRSGKHFPLMKTANFTVLPLTLHTDGPQT